MNKERLVAFTDAIVAIAATIMVLELAVPATSDWQGLIHINAMSETLSPSGSSMKK